MVAGMSGWNWNTVPGLARHRSGWGCVGCHDYDDPPPSIGSPGICSRWRHHHSLRDRGEANGDRITGRNFPQPAELLIFPLKGHHVAGSRILAGKPPGSQKCSSRGS